MTLSIGFFVRLERSKSFVHGTAPSGTTLGFLRLPGQARFGTVQKGKQNALRTTPRDSRLGACKMAVKRGGIAPAFKALPADSPVEFAQRAGGGAPRPLEQDV
jgi:hypothetical protein